MATVVSISVIRDKMQSLGWESVAVAEVVEGLKSANIPAAEFVAYLDALIAAPEGANDQTIPNCTAAHATQITSWLTSHAAVTT